MLHPSVRASAILACLIPLSSAQGASALVTRPWTVETSVSMRYYVDVGGEGSSEITASPAAAFLPSPDGSRFLTLSRQGDLGRDANLYELRIYDTEAVKAAVVANKAPPAPIRIVQRYSPPRSSVAAMEFVAWSADGRFISFDGADEAKVEEKVRARFTLDVGSGKVVWAGPYLADGDSPILILGTEASIYVDYLAPPAPVERNATYPAEAITPQFLARLEGWGGDYGGGAKDTGTTANLNRQLGLHLRRDGKSVLLAKLGGAKIYNTFGIARGGFSPKGDVAIITVSLPALPDAWRGYDRASKKIYPLAVTREGRKVEFEVPPQQFMVLDVATGETNPLMDAPTGDMTAMGREGTAISPTGRVAPDVFWSADGRTAILTNAALPLTEDPENARKAYVIAYDVESRRQQKIAALQQDGLVLQGVRWASDGRHLLTEWRKQIPRTSAIDYIVAGDSALQRAVVADSQAEALARANSVTIVYLKAADGWRRDDGWHEDAPSSAIGSSIIAWKQSKKPGGSLTFANGLGLALEESANDPQRLVASFGERHLDLSVPDPALKSVAITRSKLVSWRDTTGKLFSGLLLLPNPSPGKQAPLVLQLCKPGISTFRPDCSNSAGYAAQAMAAKGLAVLSMLGMEDPFYLKPLVVGKPNGEWEALFEYVPAALDAVSGESAVDLNRLGVIGFSHNGTQARMLLTHPGKYSFAAAIANDSFTPQLTDEWRNSAANSEPNSRRPVGAGLEALMGGSFWENKQYWLDNALELTANRASGALLETYHTGPRASRWAGYRVPLYVSAAGSFRTAGRPYEAVFNSESSHVLQGVRTRYTEMTSTVEWMSFWLNGREDPNPSKADQYARWRTMKLVWEQQQAWEKAGHPAGTAPDQTFITALSAKAELSDQPH